jgi:hypothetical protein
MTRPEKLAEPDKASLDAILAASPELAAVTASVRAFAVMMNERRGRELLEPWMTAAEATGEPALRSFVTGLVVPQHHMDRIAAWERLHFGITFVGDDWQGTESWQAYESQFAERGVQVVYFRYTEGVSSTLLRERLRPFPAAA